MRTYRIIETLGKDLKEGDEYIANVPGRSITFSKATHGDPKYECYADSIFLVKVSSPIPELTDEYVEVIMEEYMNNHWLKVGHLENRNAIASGQDFKAGIEACINFIRNKQ